MLFKYADTLDLIYFFITNSMADFFKSE